MFTDPFLRQDPVPCNVYVPAVDACSLYLQQTQNQPPLLPRRIERDVPESSHFVRRGAVAVTIWQLSRGMAVRQRTCMHERSRNESAIGYAPGAGRGMREGDAEAKQGGRDTGTAHKIERWAVRTMVTTKGRTMGWLCGTRWASGGGGGGGGQNRK